MPIMSFDLEDGKPPVSFTLRPEDARRFMDFMDECQAIKEAGSGKDARRLDFIALHGAGIRRANKGQKNLIVWGSQYPHSNADVKENLRAAIDSAMAGKEQSNGL